MSLLLGLILPFSIAGYSLLLKTKFHISFYYSPFFAINIISALMYVAGLFNIMPETAYCIGIIGTGGVLVFLKHYVNRSFFHVIKNNLFPITLMLITFIYLIWYWKDGIYNGSDTLTHWGIIARSVYKRNALPNFTCTEIAYTSYPPITSCWIYYFIIFAGYSEAKCMMAQGLWMYTCVITLFSINHKRKFLNDFLICIGGIYLMIMIEGMDGLKVDTLLPLVTGAVIVFILQYSITGGLTNKKSLIFATLIVITLIKNSGILFAVLVSIYFSICFTKDISSLTHKILLNCKVVAIPIITLYLWEKHIDMVYLDAFSSRHSLSIEAMKEIFATRTSEKIKSIVINFGDKWFSWNGSCEWQMLIFLGVSFTAFWLCKHKAKGNFFKCYTESVWIVILLVIFDVIYKIFLLGMYTFNFPGDEADSIHAYERYMGSFVVIIALLGIYFITIVGLDITNKTIYALYIIFTTFLINTYIRTSDPGLINRLSRPDYSQGTFYRNLTNILKNNVEDYSGKNMLLYISDRFAGYGIQFATDNQKSWATYNIDEIYEALDTNKYEYDGIVIMEHDELMDHVLESIKKDNETEYIPLGNN